MSRVKTTMQFEQIGELIGMSREETMAVVRAPQANPSRQAPDRQVSWVTFLSGSSRFDAQDSKSGLHRNN